MTATAPVPVTQTVRRHKLTLHALVAGCALLLGAAQAHGQVYRCGSSFQNSPCDTRGTRLVGAGASPSYNMPRQSSLPSIEAPPAYYSKLSAHCQSLNDAMRTANIRGIRDDTMRGVRAEWAQDCSADASIAQRETQHESEQLYKQKTAMRQAADEEKLRPERERVICQEMAVALANKERKAQNNPGEQADLQRFKEGYNSRCVKR